MPLIKDGQLSEDLFRDVTHEDEMPGSGAVLVSVAQWEQHRDELLQRDGPVGILLQSDQHPELIADDLEHFAMVALEFPAFRDGRPYSYARLLRDRYEYPREIRAVGDVLLEQLHYMHRSGFDAFLIGDENADAQWQIADGDFSVWYQPTGDGRSTALQLRHRNGH